MKKVVWVYITAYCGLYGRIKGVTGGRIKGVRGAVEKVPLILYIGYQFFMLFSSMEV